MKEAPYEFECDLRYTIGEKPHIKRITYLDEVEYACWGLFKTYAYYLGVEFNEEDKDEIDFSIAKDIQDYIISKAEEVFGVKFPLPEQINDT